MNPLLVEARNITKRFPGVLALDGVRLRVYGGQVNALVGENGAGKSTLMNILSGVYTDYEGEVLVDGQVQHFSSVTDAQAKGIAIIHQELNVIPYLNVAENIFLGREPVTRLHLIDKSRMHNEARELLKRLHSDIDTHALMVDLRVGQQQIVEIAKALSLQAKVLIMDEPTSSLSESETRSLFDIIRQLKSQGVGIVYISHKMDEIRQLADTVTIMRDGKLIDERPIANTSIDEIVAMMVGRDKSDFFVKGIHPLGDVALAVRQLSLRDDLHPERDVLHDISFEVRAGEVLGIYGLMGAGRTELFESLFGLYPKRTVGEIRIGGERVRITHPEDAVRHGMALLPEDRKVAGLVLDMNVRENTTLTNLRRCLTVGLLDSRKEEALAGDYRQRLNIKSYSLRQKAGQLSGGNQQKIVVAKWMLTSPRVLMLDEPTRGIDILAKNEVYRIIDQLAAQGMALIVVSSELPEIMAIADRILTLRQGRMGATFVREDFSEASILKAALPHD